MFPEYALVLMYSTQVGIVIGLAIYNGHILEFRFPMVTYKKLMGLPTDLSDLAEVS
jgi:hypothetical protein